MVRVPRLGCRKSPEVKPRLCRLKALSNNQAGNGYFFESKKDNSAEEDRWAPLFLCCAKDTDGL